MKYLLDTNVWAAFLNDPNSAVAKRIELTPLQDLTLCSVVKAELLYGARKGTRSYKNLSMLRELFGRFVSIPFDDAAAEAYAVIRAELAQRGQIIGPNDLMIASIAFASGLIVVTHNLGEFSRVSGLLVEDWQATP
jgi:tRNA(fMet)-specific endonuclease VapC